jgi:beta-phosphoglucomutase-like phosphatase (HAD superfamily)
MPIRAFLFDMDGLLVDTEALHLGAFVDVCASCGLSETIESLSVWVGKGQHRLASWIEATAPRPAGVPELLERQRREFFRRLEEVRPAPQPGVDELLALAVEEDLHVGLVSNSDRELVDRTMAHVLRSLGRGGGLAHTFPVVVTRDDVEEPKPSPEPYLKAAAAMGLDPGACLVFEDSPSGAAAARAAGCPLVVVPCPYLPEPSEASEGADASFDSLILAAEQRIWDRF